MPPAQPNAIVPTGVRFHRDTIVRRGGPGDNWCITWAGDDTQIVSMDDGLWIPTRRQRYHNRLYRLRGGPGDFESADIPAYPDFTMGAGSWFGYGLVSGGGVLYSVVSKTPQPRWSGPFRGIKLLRSDDGGRSWARVNRSGRTRPLAPDDPARHDVSPREMFFLEESPRPHQQRVAYPFSYFDFVQHGRDNTAAPDAYLYIYGPEGARSQELLLARAPADALGRRDAWEYFVAYADGGQPRWSGDLEDRRPVHVFPDRAADGARFGWYSWLPCVVWNERLGLYIMVSGGTYAGRGLTDSDADYYCDWMHTRTGSLGFWWARRPFGPWRRFFYTDAWVADAPENRTYQPKLSPQWIGPTGREMVLIWSDAMPDAAGRSHTTNYTWNQMRITIRTRP